MTLLTSPLADSITKRLTELGVPVPKQIESLMALKGALADAAADQDVDGRLREQILDGSLTVKNAPARLREAAVARATGEAARRIVPDLDSAIEARAARIVGALQDEIIVALRPVFDQAAKAIDEARQLLGPFPNADAMLAAGPQAVATWHARQAAADTLAAIRKLVVQDLRRGQLEHVSWWLAEVGDIHELERARSVMANRIPNVVDAGFPVRLNTLAEAQAVVAAAQSAPTAESVRLAEAKRAAQESGRRETEAWMKLAKQPSPTG